MGDFQPARVIKRDSFFGEDETGFHAFVADNFEGFSLDHSELFGLGGWAYSPFPLHSDMAEKCRNRGLPPF